MLSYLFIGANDVERSAAFYKAILTPLGYRHDREEHYCFYLPDCADKSNGPGSVHISKPFNGEPATPGNGMMPAFRADSRHQSIRCTRPGSTVAAAMKDRRARAKPIRRTFTWPICAIPKATSLLCSTAADGWSLLIRP